jgi:hypothetical protein
MRAAFSIRQHLCLIVPLHLLPYVPVKPRDKNDDVSSVKGVEFYLEEKFEVMHGTPDGQIVQRLSLSPRSRPLKAICANAGAQDQSTMACHWLKTKLSVRTDILCRAFFADELSF